MTITQVTRTPVRVKTKGKVPKGMVELAVAKANSLLRHTRRPVLSTSVMLTMAADPAVAQPAVASVNVDLNGRLVRAQAASESMRGAIDEVVSRLRVRLERVVRNRADLRGRVPRRSADAWRHPSIPAHRHDHFAGTAAEPSVICQVSRASGGLTAVEAAAELDLLDYDFLLFTDVLTGADSMIYRSGSGYALALVRRDHPASTFPVPESIRVSDQSVPRLAAADAILRLEALGEQFMFYLDEDSGRGNVVYHRYDGDYGLATPSPSAEPPDGRDTSR